MEKNPAKQVHYKQNSLTSLEFSIFTIFDPKMFFNFWKGKNYKSLNRIRTHDLQIRILRSNPLYYGVG